MSRAMSGACLALWLCGAQAAPPADLDKLLSGFDVPRKNIGLYVGAVDGAGGPVSLNAEHPFNPASVIKLLPSLAALELFTPVYRWTTGVFKDGRVAGRVLHGNLHIQGGGDPYLTVERLWALLKRVRAHGIERIAGDIVVDEGVYNLPAFDRAAFDDEPHRLYNGPAGGLMANFWGVQFTVTSVADAVHVDAFPGSDRLVIVNRVEHSNAACTRARRRVGLRIEENADSVTAVLDGRLSSRCPPVVISRAAIPPGRYLEYVLPGLWRDAGGVLDGTVRRGTVPGDAGLVYRHHSRPMAEAVRATNKFSNNMMARHLLLTLGSRYRERGIEVSDGINTLYNWMDARGIEMPGLNIVNGSGLSRDVRVSAAGLANLLRAGFHSRYAPEFLSSFPVAGEDWALERRQFAGGSPGAVRLKTGLIDHVRAMAGYVPSRSGGTYIVVLLINHPDIHRGLGTRMQNALVQYVLGL